MKLWRVTLASRALGWVIAVELWRRSLDFGELLFRLETRPLGPSSTIAPATARSAVRRVSRLLPLRGSCLRESLASVGLLRSLGYPARLAIGVKHGGDPVNAHAWVEVDGITVESGRGYHRLDRGGAAGGSASTRASQLTASFTFWRPSRIDTE